MSRLDDLLRQVRRADESLADDLEREIRHLRQRRAFGLNFERHAPEVVELPGRPIRRGDQVHVRGESSERWRVAGLSGSGAGRKASLVRGEEVREVEVSELVVVAEFRDRIYPGLASTGRVARGGDKPFHTVISAENFHALEALCFTHEGRVDAIYIDPPYNTRDKDWKYNNDYVDKDDVYRHSKWLAFMERRLLLAKRLLRPESGVLVATIDENEGSRLHLLLNQTFPEYDISPVHIVHNPRGIQGDNFSFIHETAYYVVPAKQALIAPRALTAEEIREGTSNFRNWGGESERRDAANCFYPVLVKDGLIVGFGDDVTSEDAIHPSHNEVMGDGTVKVWPIDPKGVERKWRYARHTVESIRHLLVVKAIERGPFKGDFEIQIAKSEAKQKTVWQGARYDASTYGTQTVGALLPGRAFPYPKSLYAVEDCLSAVVRARPDAVVLDFFAGSGTTAHAVMRLNRQDGGRRQCISVTNNEVSADEQRELRRQGLRPGDPEWERHGICEYITKPRIAAAVSGMTPDGVPIKGDYKFTDEFPMRDGFDENVEFFTLTYEARDAVQHHRSFRRLAPLLWLRAGARGSRIDEPADDFAVADAYAVLFDLDATADFVTAVTAQESVRMVFVVTDDDRGYQSVCAALPRHVETVRLYASYLTSFELGAETD